MVADATVVKNRNNQFGCLGGSGVVGDTTISDLSHNRFKVGVYESRSFERRVRPGCGCTRMNGTVPRRLLASL